MRTNCFVGTAIDAKSWGGFHVDWEFPESAAATLLDRISGLHGDLPRVAQAIREAALFPTGGYKPLTPSELDAGHAWGFLLEVERRQVRVFRRGARSPQPNAPLGLESYDELMQLPIAANGDAPNFRELSFWSRCNVIPGWYRSVLDEQKAALLRAETLDRYHLRGEVVKACEVASLPVDELRAQLVLGFEHLLTSAPWPGEPPKRLLMELPSAGSSLGLDLYWAFEFGGLELRYGVTSYRGLFPASADERIAFWAECPSRRVEIATSREALLSHLETDAAKWLRPVLAAFPKAPRWLFSALDFVRSFTVPSEADTLLAWRSYVHPDGRHWAVRVTSEGYELRFGVEDPDDPPLIRARRSENPEAEADGLVREQLAEGFVQATSA